MQRDYWFTDYDTDVVTNRKQPQTLPDDFDYRASAAVSAVVNPLATTFAWGYRLTHGVKIIGAERLVPGAFIYANHTQPLGDVFLPRTLHQPVAIVAGAANRGVPILGRLLPYGRALMLPSGRRQYPNFLKSLRVRHDRGEVILIYPEAHVWPYYTGIRPFAAAALHYPISLQAPVYTLTTTYAANRRLVLYLDGPLPYDQTAPRKRQQAQAHAAVSAQLRQRAAQSLDTGVRYHHVLEGSS